MTQKRTSGGGTKLLRAPALTRLGWLAHGFTTRSGAGNLSFSRGPANVVEKSRQALLATLPPSRGGSWQLVTLKQLHSDIVVVPDGEFPPLPVSRTSHGGMRREPDGALKLTGDALITRRPGLLLAVQTADCLPILLADPERRVVAVVHAGWRGTAGRVAEKTVGRMRLELGCDPKALRAALGPGIHHCCYQVGPEVVEEFESRFDYAAKVVRRVKPSPSQVHWQQPLFSAQPPTAERRPRPALTAPPGEELYLDLVEANRRQLRAAGLSARNIWASPLCTACRTDLLFSHRAEHGEAGRQMGVIGLRG